MTLQGVGGARSADREKHHLRTIALHGSRQPGGPTTFWLWSAIAWLLTLLLKTATTLASLRSSFLGLPLQSLRHQELCWVVGIPLLTWNQSSLLYRSSSGNRAHSYASSHLIFPTVLWGWQNSIYISTAYIRWLLVGGSGLAMPMKTTKGRNAEWLVRRLQWQRLCAIINTSKDKEDIPTNSF